MKSFEMQSGMAELFAIIISAITLYYFTFNPSNLYAQGVGNFYLIGFLVSSLFISITRLLSSQLNSRLFEIAVYLFGIIISPYILMMPLAYDDWTYVGNSLTTLNLMTTYSGHHIPIIVLINYVLDYFFHLSPLPYTLGLVIANLVVLLGIARTFQYYEIGPREQLIAFCLFIVCPAIIFSRSWYGGGFWFTLGLGFFVNSLPHLDRFIYSSKKKFADLFYAGVLAAASFFTLSLFKYVLINYAPILIPKLPRKFYIYSIYVAFLALIALIYNQYSLAPTIASFVMWLRITLESLLISNYYRYLIPETGVVPRIGNHDVDIGDIYIFAIIIFSLFIFFIYYFFSKSDSKGKRLQWILIFNFAFFFAAVLFARGRIGFMQGYYQILPVTLLIMIVSISCKTSFILRNSLLIFVPIMVVFHGWAYVKLAHDDSTSVAAQKQVEFLSLLADETCELLLKNNTIHLVLPDLDVFSDFMDSQQILRVPESYATDGHSLYRKLVTRGLRDRCSPLL